MFCNLFMERPSYYYCHYLNDCYTIACVLQLATDTGRVCCVDAPLVLVIFRDGWILIFFLYIGFAYLEPNIHTELCFCLILTAA